MFDKHITRMHFERAAESYDGAAGLQREIAKRIADRLDKLNYQKHQPTQILDVGCGTGYITKDLLERYPQASVLALDLAHSMARKTESLEGLSRKPKAICADAESLPFKEDSIDFIVSSLMLQWSNDLNKVFNGFHHVLAPNGLLLFSTFGPKTLSEIRQSWSVVDNYPHTSRFSDKHEITNALVQAGFQNPVVDMEMITMTYDSVRQLMRDIKQIGASNTDSNRSKGLMGKKKLKAFETAYERYKTTEGLYPASWEIIYGHARVKI